MVKEFYAMHGFEKTEEDTVGNTIWVLQTTGYQKKNKVIEIKL